MQKSRYNRLTEFAAWGLIALGSVLRVRQYLSAPSLWLDEAMLALNIVNRSFGELVRPLDYDQGAPLGFLWIIKALVSVLENNEFSLRLFPLLAGCLALVVFWQVTRQLVQPLGGLFALLIFASSNYVVSYSAQVKQYSVDAAITLLLYLVALNYLRKNPSRKDYLLLAGFGGLFIWISHPAVFTLMGIGLVFIGTAALKRDWRIALNYGAASVFWLINFLALYLIQYRGLTSNVFLTGFWSEYFMPLSLSAPGWVLNRLAGLFFIPGGFSSGTPAALILILFFAGVISLFLNEKRWMWMFALSLAFTLAASSLGKYPFGGRMGMFALPGLLICTGEGLGVLRRLFTHRPTLGLVITLLLTAYLAVPPLSFSIELAIKPKMTENIAPTMAYLKSNIHEGDVIYLYPTAIPAFRYYSPKYGLEGVQVINGTDAHENRLEYRTELDQLAGKKRVWLLFSHLTDPVYVEDRDYILDYANQIGAKKREFSETGTKINLYLYDLAP